MARGTQKMDINIGDIVSFGPSAVHGAAIFCRTKGITGKVVRRESGMLVVDVGFDYEVFSKPENLALVATHKEIPHPEDIGN